MVLILPSWNLFLFFNQRCCSWPEEKLGGKINQLNATDDGESSEKAHSASDQADLIGQFYLCVSLNLVKGGSVKEDLNKLKGWLVYFNSWRNIVVNL